MSACIASLFECPVEYVPLFLSEPGDTSRFQWAQRLDEWLGQFGLYALHFTCNPRLLGPFGPIEEGGKSRAMPGVYYILGGLSPRGRPHAVIAKGCEIVHDPHPDKTGLVSVDGLVILCPTWT